MLSTQPLGFPRVQTLTAEERHAEPGVCLSSDPPSNQVVEVLLADLRKGARHILGACDPQNDNWRPQRRWKIHRHKILHFQGSRSPGNNLLQSFKKKKKMRKLGPREGKRLAYGHTAREWETWQMHLPEHTPHTP